jgi:ribosomal protein S27AE
VDLKSLPQNTCPLCREAALALKGDRWKCGHCGCIIEFDADTRHSRIAHFPPQYAALKAALADEWLTRRELFERVDEARLAAETDPEARASSSLPLGPIAVVALTLMVLCIMLSAIAAAIVVSPAVARTRRAISAAYRPTQTPIPAVVEALATEPPVVIESPVLQPAVITPTDSIGVSEAVTATPQLVEAPTLTPTMVLAAPTVALPPTNTPVPPTAVPTAPLPPTVTPTVTPTVSIAGTATITAVISPLTSPVGTTVTVTPTVAAQQPQPPPVNATAGPTPTTVPNGAVIFQGTLQVSNIKAVGDPNLAEADEYVEIKNIGSQPVYVDGWSLKVFLNNQQRDQFVFTNGAVFAAGQLCRIYTNLASGPDSCGFAFGFANDEPLWPNGGGARASLFNQQNIEVARFTY